MTIDMSEFEPEEEKHFRAELDPELCPVCQGKSQVESLEAEGLVLTGVKGILYRDAKTITEVMEVSDQYTAHTAISLYAKSLYDICDIIGADWRDILDAYREQITAALHEASGSG